MQNYIYNLSFIKRLSKELYKPYEEAERFLYSAPDFTLVTLRSFVVLCVEILCKSYSIPHKQNFWKLIKSELNDKIPEEIIEKLKQIRLEGNKAAHPEEYPRSAQEKIESAKSSLKNAYQVGCWMHRTLVCKEEYIPEYTEPEEKNTHQIYYDAIISNHGESQYLVGMELKNRNDKHVADVLWKVKEEKEGLNLFKYDYKDALYWFDKASMMNQHPAASYQAGFAYFHGVGVKKDEKKSLDYFFQGANYQNSDCQFVLGKFYMEGTFYIDQNYQEALEYFEFAAQQDHPGALYSLAEMYHNGEGVKKNDLIAHKYISQAVELGYPSAYYKLAYFYENGIIVEKNLDEALSHYAYAANKGNANAQIALFCWYKKSNPTLALEKLRQAELSNHIEAFYHMGILYQEGVLVQKDLHNAYFYLDLYTKENTKNEGEFYENAQIEKEKIFRENTKSYITETEDNKLKKKKIGRNDPCPCESGKKYKKCCEKEQKNND